MTERKTDILNVRLDSALAAEIDRIAGWRGKSASEVARDLMKFGVAAERDLQAQELKQSYGSPPIDRNAENVRIVVEAHYRFLTVNELEAMREEFESGEYVETRHPAT
jgi:metal-responsive CopG/Arc/MetJ family transcriptional regulator